MILGMAAVEDDGALETYLDLRAEEIGRLILCLMIEEELRRRLATFLPPLPGEWTDDQQPNISALNHSKASANSASSGRM